MKPYEILEQARKVLRIEKEAIECLSRRLDESFNEAVELLLKCEGRVIVTGIGKSGIVGRKIAATLASTGIPALFLHTSEGLHGDLGVITKGDVVLAISYSGETPEILELLPTIKRLGVKLIAFCGNTTSALAQAADICLDISVEREACPLGLVPTASTTATLALGDALAVVLLLTRGFNIQDFAALHPGGSLGKRLLLRVSDLMRTGENNPVVEDKTLVKDALFVMTKTRLGATSVIDSNGKLIGVFTDGDLRRCLERNSQALYKPIKELMTKTPIVTKPDKLAAEAGRILQERQVDNLPVVNEAYEPIGMLDIQDLLKAGLI